MSSLDGQKAQKSEGKKKPEKMARREGEGVKWKRVEGLDRPWSLVQQSNGFHSDIIFT